VQFIHNFGFGHQDRHGAEGFATEISVQPSDYHPQSSFGEFLGDGDDLVIKELGFVNTYYGCVSLQFFQDDIGGFYWDGIVLTAGMRGHFLYGVAIVNGGLENLHFLASNGRPAETPNQFIGLTAEHRPGDNFYGSGVVFHLSLLSNKMGVILSLALIQCKI
jgi:hypothetical protein